MKKIKINKTTQLQNKIFYFKLKKNKINHTYKLDIYTLIS